MCCLLTQRTGRGRTDAFASISRMEEYIKNQDVAGYRQDVAIEAWRWDFLHVYAATSIMGDGVVRHMLGHENVNASVFDVVTAGQEASVCFLFLNHYEAWLRPKTGKAGRWTRRGAGWTAEGLQFHADACSFFRAIRQSEEFSSDKQRALEWYATNMDDNHHDRDARRSGGGNKRRRGPVAAPDYSELRRSGM